MIYSFKNDYSSIAHPLVLEKMLELNSKQFIGYGEDEITKEATKLIQDKIKKDSDVFFLVGGTQANMTVISGLLKPYEAVIAVESGHINVHETGAVEGKGIKVLTAKGNDGKISVADIDNIIKLHTDYHMVLPKMVYISNTTEVGTYYTKSEVIDIYNYCKKNNLYLFIDGARLASALAISDMTYEDYANYTDVFYIGGTKNGAYIGEAVVINNKDLSINFKYTIKHNGAMLAKGFVGALPFTVLMKDNLYLEIGKNENECAAYIVDELTKLGVKFDSNSKTNQIFPIIRKDLLDDLYNDYPFEKWREVDTEFYAIRFVTSFTTNMDICTKFVKYMKNILQ